MPGLARRAALRGQQEVLERHVQKGGASLGERLLGVEELPAHPQAASALRLHARTHEQLGVDRHGPPEAHEAARGHGGEAVPGGEQAAGLVERGRDKTAVDDARPALVALVEAEARFVELGALLRWRGKPEAEGTVAAAEAGRVVVGRDARQRRPPRSWWARKKFSEPAVAIAAEADTSSASAAAATICAKR